MRLNAIVLRGPAQQVASYEHLIDELDMPAGLVEIEAVTIDVNRSRLEELGIDWQLSGGNLTLGMGDPKAASPATVLTLGGPTSNLLARIRAMEQAGDAYVIGRPSILTTENLGAMIDLSQTINVRVTGERVANLVPVPATAATAAPVVPTVVLEAERYMAVQQTLQQGLSTLGTLGVASELQIQLNMANFVRTTLVIRREGGAVSLHCKSGSASERNWFRLNAKELGGRLRHATGLDVSLSVDEAA